MSRFRVSDLEPISPDAAELIDSAQDAAKKLARCCAEKDAEIARLRGAISEFVEAFDRDPIKYADLMDRTREAVAALCLIAREG